MSYAIFFVGNKKVKPYLCAMLFLLIGASGFFIFENSNLGVTNRSMEKKVISLRSKLIYGNAAFPVGGGRQQFLLKFGSLSSISVDIGNQFSDARLVLNEAAFYPTATQPWNDVARVQINVSARGSFGAMRQALGRLLSRHGELALKSLIVSRDGASDATPRMAASLILFYRK